MVQDKLELIDQIGDEEKMLKFIKKLFSLDSKFNKYRYELFQFLLLSTFIFSLFLLFYLLKLDEHLIIRILSGLILGLYFYMIAAFIGRLTVVADNIELVNSLKGNIKFKNSPIKFTFEEISFFIRNTKNPETIYVKSINKGYHMIDIAYDVKGRKGPFYNKQYYFDGIQIKSIDEFLKTIYDNTVISDYIMVYGTFDKKSPEILSKLINELKK